MRTLFADHAIDTVVHFAAESHVDRSIDAPLDFIDTNVRGTAVLLEAARVAWAGRSDVRFHHVSTDEVFGSLGPDGLFSEDTPYDPSSPYSASKAAADHLARAWHRTYGLPVTLSNCSNNYGPYQFPEKLIPLMILNAVAGKPLPVYGDGGNVRDWLYVERPLRGRRAGRPPRPRRPDVQHRRDAASAPTSRSSTLLCDIVDELLPRPGGGSRRELVSFVTDRPGHDRRYAIDAQRIEGELGWRPDAQLRAGPAPDRGLVPRAPRLVRGGHPRPLRRPPPRPRKKLTAAQHAASMPPSINGSRESAHSKPVRHTRSMIAKSTTVPGTSIRTPGRRPTPSELEHRREERSAFDGEIIPVGRAEVPAKPDLRICECRKTEYSLEIES